MTALSFEEFEAIMTELSDVFDSCSSLISIGKNLERADGDKVGR